jgi:hypothetical protein
MAHQIHHLTTFPYDPLLDLDPWVGQRQASYRFYLTNGVTGKNLGTINPIRGASLSHDSARTIKRQLSLALGVSDLNNIDPVTDRISVSMVFPSGAEFPMGRYMFSPSSRQVFTSGRLGNMVLTDEMFLVDQQIRRGVNGVGQPVTTTILAALEGLPVNVFIEPSPFMGAEAWGVGTNRGTILESLAVSGDFFSPWFDNNGDLRFIRTFNPADRIPDFDLDEGNSVMRAGIVETDNLLTAPNTFVVISNAAEDTSSPIVGVAHVPPNAPNSVVNRGFEIVETVDLQLATEDQAQQVAIGLVNRQTIYETVSLSTAPDPRYDGYNVVHWQADFWLGLSWSLTLQEGSPMQHQFRRAYQGGPHND